VTLRRFILKRGSSELVCWLDANRVTEGKKVRLKGIEGWWLVVWQSLGTLSSDNVKRDWRVGGLK
jgi:hypothetical protein